MATAERRAQQRTAAGPNEKLINALQVFGAQGLPGLQDLVKRGLAPALGVGLLAPWLYGRQGDQ